MTIWVDAQLSPALAGWLRDRCRVNAVAVRDLGLRDATDREIFFAAREAHAVILTKDSDFVELVVRHSPPPSVIWLTCGNTSNDHLMSLLERVWPALLPLIEAGEPLVEVR